MNLRGLLLSLNWVTQGAGGIAGVIRFINGSKGRMTQLKHELAASTSRFRQGYQDEAVLLSMVLEGDRGGGGKLMGFSFCKYSRAIAHRFTLNINLSSVQKYICNPFGRDART